MRRTGDPDPDGSLGESALAELSGLIATVGGRLIGLNDGGSTVRVVVLGPDCALVEVIEPDP